MCAGVGPWLKLFSVRKELLCEEVLKGKRIHGIHTGKNISPYRSCTLMLLILGKEAQQQMVLSRVPLVVYGQKTLRIVEVVKDRGTPLPL